MSTNKRTFKTKKKLSKGQTNYRKWDEWEVGDVVIGTFVSQGEDQFEKPNWELKVVEAFFPNDKKLAAKLKGKSLTLNSAGFLNKAMAKVDEGEMVQITYNGMGEMTKGKYKGKDAHSGEVELVTEDTGDDGEENEESEENDEDFDL